MVLATRNAGKLRELSALFAEAGFVLDDLASVGLGEEDPAEDALEVFDTFEENARAKARWFAAKLPGALEGALVVADDSGLTVDSLDGAPGVRSKRWSGSGASGAALEAANNAHLLGALGEEASRAAAYVSVVVCTDGAREWSARGECRGRILTAPRGEGGFGYDPLFWSDDLQCTFAEATRDAKAGVSHRGRAFRALVKLLAGASSPL